jgi:hypothetical protein
MPTAAFIPPARPANGQAGSSSATAKRKGILIGSITAAVVLIIAVVLIMVNQGGSNTGGGTPPSPGSSGSKPTSASPTSTASSTPSSALGQTPNAGAVDFSQAGQMVDQYIGSVGTEASWNLLTPGAQAVFGSFPNFQAYWNQHKINGYSSIRADTGRNSDGSVDMYVSIDGAGRPHWRVVNTGAGMRIDADTHIG